MHKMYDAAEEARKADIEVIMRTATDWAVGIAFGIFLGYMAARGIA